MWAARTDCQLSGVYGNEWILLSSNGTLLKRRRRVCPSSEYFTMQVERTTVLFEPIALSGCGWFRWMAGIAFAVARLCATANVRFCKKWDDMELRTGGDPDFPANYHSYKNIGNSHTTTMHIRMSTAQRARVLEAFEAATHPAAHREVWARRSYAPMHIFEDEFESLRWQIRGALPDYAIAFDVIFESRGNTVDWHCDYESLGPFVVPNRWAAVRDHHFLTVHFNLTEDGGSLVTLPWTLASYVFHLSIAWCGIFSRTQRMLTWVLWPAFVLFASKCSNKALRGNIFDNTRLHMVTAGAPRISYVVRLVRKGRVQISKKSIMLGANRSDACTVFEPMSALISETEIVDAASFDWNAIANVC